MGKESKNNVIYWVTRLLLRTVVKRPCQVAFPQSQALWRQVDHFERTKDYPSWNSPSQQNYNNSRKSILKIQIQRKSKRKTKTKTQRVKQPTGGRFAPPSQVPPLAFLFSFSFWFTLNLNFPHPPPPAPVPRREKKNREKNEVWLKWKFRSWRSILAKNHQNWSYPRVFLSMLKFGKNRKRYTVKNGFKPYLKKIFQSVYFRFD